MGVVGCVWVVLWALHVRIFVVCSVLLCVVVCPCFLIVVCCCKRVWMCRVSSCCVLMLVVVVFVCLLPVGGVVWRGLALRVVCCCS